MDEAWVPPSMRTPRLTMRAQTADDAPVLRQLWLERDPRVPPHRQIDADGRPTVAEIADGIRTHPAPGLLTVELGETGEVIGYCGVVLGGPAASDRPEIAFELLRAVHNRGYATEAGEAVLAWATSVGHRYIWASVWDWNLPSRRTLEKLGFTETDLDLGRTSEHGRTILTTLPL